MSQIKLYQALIWIAQLADSLPEPTLEQARFILSEIKLAANEALKQ